MSRVFRLDGRAVNSQASSTGSRGSWARGIAAHLRFELALLDRDGTVVSGKSLRPEGLQGFAGVGDKDGAGLQGMRGMSTGAANSQRSAGILDSGL